MSQPQHFIHPHIGSHGIEHIELIPPVSAMVHLNEPSHLKKVLPNATSSLNIYLLKIYLLDLPRYLLEYNNI